MPRKRTRLFIMPTGWPDLPPLPKPDQDLRCQRRLILRKEAAVVVLHHFLRKGGSPSEYKRLRADPSAEAELTHFSCERPHSLASPTDQHRSAPIRSDAGGYDPEGSA